VTGRWDRSEVKQGDELSPAFSTGTRCSRNRARCSAMVRSRRLSRWPAQSGMFAVGALVLAAWQQRARRATGAPRQAD